MRDFLALLCLVARVSECIRFHPDLHGNSSIRLLGGCPPGPGNAILGTWGTRTAEDTAAVFSDLITEFTNAGNTIATPTEVLDASYLNTINAFFPGRIADGEPLDPAEQAALRNWVYHQGGVLYVPTGGASAGDLEATNSYLAPFGHEVTGAITTGHPIHVNRGVLWCDGDTEDIYKGILEGEAQIIRPGGRKAPYPGNGWVPVARSQLVPNELIFTFHFTGRGVIVILPGDLIKSPVATDRGEIFDFLVCTLIPEDICDVSCIGFPSGNNFKECIDVALQQAKAGECETIWIVPGSERCEFVFRSELADYISGPFSQAALTENQLYADVLDPYWCARKCMQHCDCAGWEWNMVEHTCKIFDTTLTDPTRDATADLAVTISGFVAPRDPTWMAPGHWEGGLINTLHNVLSVEDCFQMCTVITTECDPSTVSYFWGRKECKIYNGNSVFMDNDMGWYSTCTPLPTTEEDP